MVDMARLEDKPLGYLLYRVTSALRAEVSAAVMAPLELSFTQYLCLRIVSQFPGTTNAELARETHVSPQAMNKVIRELQDRGLVTRPATVPSGRSRPTTLTAAGGVLLERADPLIFAAELRVLGNLSEGDRREFLRLLAAAV
jgi:DNA-binding MarR family transcriptional regulator